MTAPTHDETPPQPPSRQLSADESALLAELWQLKQAHKPTLAYVTSTAPLIMRHAFPSGSGWVFPEVVIPSGSTLKVVMLSRFGDIGLTHHLDATHGYGLRILPDDSRLSNLRREREPMNYSDLFEHIWCDSDDAARAARLAALAPATRTAWEILDMLSGRKGFDWWWEDIPSDVHDVIFDLMRDRVRLHALAPLAQPGMNTGDPAPQNAAAAESSVSPSTRGETRVQAPHGASITNPTGNA